MNKLFIFKLGMSGCAVCYVWLLPLLSKIGFSESDSDSISAFIANPPATGAMAAISFIPLTLVWEYQDIVLENLPLINDCNIIWLSNTLYYTTAIYQVSYGSFLICTYGYVKSWVHSITVVCFCGSFIGHSLLTLNYSTPSNVTKGILGVGSASGLILIGLSILNISSMWFWFFECIGISAMFIYTPIEWIIIRNKIKLADTIEGSPEEGCYGPPSIKRYEGCFYTSSNSQEMQEMQELQEGLLSNDDSETI